MLFNSTEFLVFGLAALTLHWYAFSGSARRQNAFLLAASWFFYAWWDWRFLGLLILAGATSFAAGLGVAHSEENTRARRGWFLFGVLTNLGVLALFKYYDFFVRSFSEAFLGGIDGGLLLNLALPVGVSFYSFQAIGYCADVFLGRVPAEKSPLRHFTFISFFPQLLAGPIGRAGSLLPQFTEKRVFDSALATDGLRQILWGLFKKTVVADNCAAVVDAVWTGGVGNASPLTLAGAAVLYSFQIYGDFSGYSDMAIGTAKLFGVRLGDNFLFPYFSRDPQEFWRRWHISLNTWFRDFVYIPLGGSRAGKLRTLRNLFVVFGLSGLWHGANWTFVCWGLFHALLFLPRTLFGRKRKNTTVIAENVALPSLTELTRLVVTFIAVTIGWVFFRAPTIGEAFAFLENCIVPAGTETFGFNGTPFLFIGMMLVVEWIQRRGSHALYRVFPFPRPVRWALYGLFLFFIFQNDGMQENFIYFRF